jgi:hypothetical protein
MTRSEGAEPHRCQLQMPPDLHGQVWIRVSRACASSGLPCRFASLTRAAPRECSLTRAARRGCSTFVTLVSLGFDRDRREFGIRAETLRRQYRLGEVEAEELIGTVVISHRQAAQSQKPGTKRDDKSAFQDHLRPPEMTKTPTDIM